MDALSVKEIRQIAKSRGVQAYYKMNKATLLNALEPPPPESLSPPPPPSPPSTGLYFTWESFGRDSITRGGPSWARALLAPCSKRREERWP